MPKKEKPKRINVQLPIRHEEAEPFKHRAHQERMSFASWLLRAALREMKRKPSV